MSTDDMKDDEFEAYLNGKSPLSDTYRSLPEEQPSEDSDQHLRAAAREAIDKHPRVASSPFSSNWAIPASIAAVLVLAISIVALMPELERESQFSTTSDALHPEHDTLTKQPLVASSPSARTAAKPSAPQTALSTDKEQLMTDEAGKTRTFAQKARPEAAEQASQQPARRIAEETRVRQEKQLQIESKQKAEAVKKFTAKEDLSRERLSKNLAAPAASGAALRPAPSDWLNHIKQLRTQGDLNNANIAMDQFIEFYFGKPPYPHQDMLSLLDEQDRQRFLAELEALKRTEEKQALEKILIANPYPKP